MDCKFKRGDVGGVRKLDCKRSYGWKSEAVFREAEDCSGHTSTEFPDPSSISFCSVVRLMKMAASSQHFRLLDLPRELRDRCYHFALLESCTTFSEHDVRFHVHYLRPRSEAFLRCDLLLSMHWLLASKQVLAEAVEQFYRHSTCTSIEQPSAHSAHRTAIFTCSRIQRLDLSIGMGFHKEDVERRQVVSIFPRIRNWTLFIAKKEAFLPRLQEVGLRFSIRSVDIDRSLRYLRFGMEVNINFAALEALGTAIPLVEIDIWHPSIPVPTSADPSGYGDSFNYSRDHYQKKRHVVERIKGEIERVANVVIVTEGGAGRKKLDWRETKEGEVCNWKADLKRGISA